MGSVKQTAPLLPAINVHKLFLQQRVRTVPWFQNELQQFKGLPSFPKELYRQCDLWRSVSPVTFCENCCAKSNAVVNPVDYHSLVRSRDHTFGC